MTRRPHLKATEFVYMMLKKALAAVEFVQQLNQYFVKLSLKPSNHIINFNKESEIISTKENAQFWQHRKNLENDREINRLAF